MPWLGGGSPPPREDEGKSSRGPRGRPRGSRICEALDTSGPSHLVGQRGLRESVAIFGLRELLLGV